MTAASFTLSPRHWYNWDFALQDSRQTLAEFDLSSWRENGTITVDGHAYRVSRQGFASGAFLIEHEGKVLASAVKPSPFRSAFVIDFEGQRYSLRKRSIWTHTFVVFEADTAIGTLTRTGWLTRDTAVDVPSAWPMSMTAFVCWLAILLWKREADSGGGA